MCALRTLFCPHSCFILSHGDVFWCGGVTIYLQSVYHQHAFLNSIKVLGERYNDEISLRIYPLQHRGKMARLATKMLKRRTYFGTVVLQIGQGVSRVGNKKTL